MTHGSNLPECQSACTLAHPCLANMFVSCKKQLSWYTCASLVLLGMKRVCICAVFGGVCCLPSKRWLLCGDDGSKKTKTKSVIPKNFPASHYGFNYSKQKRIKHGHYRLKLIRKICTTHFCNYFRANGIMLNKSGPDTRCRQHVLMRLREV